ILASDEVGVSSGSLCAPTRGVDPSLDAQADRVSDGLGLAAVVATDEVQHLIARLMEVNPYAVAVGHGVAIHLAHRGLQEDLVSEFWSEEGRDDLRGRCQAELGQLAQRVLPASLDGSALVGHELPQPGLCL